MTVEDMKALLHRDGALQLKLRVIPKSPRTCWAGVLDDGTVKLRLHATPEKGKANEELIRFIAAELGVARPQVRIVAGLTSHSKQIRISV
jgi:hypothetical protein